MNALSLGCHSLNEGPLYRVEGERMPSHPSSMESAAPNGPVVRGRCHSPCRYVFAAFAEFERNLIRERTVAGLKGSALAAKGARPTSSDPKKLDRYPEVRQCSRMCPIGPGISVDVIDADLPGSGPFSFSRFVSPSLSTNPPCSGSRIPGSVSTHTPTSGLLNVRHLSVHECNFHVLVDRIILNKT
jgi:hypothetical protein